MCRAKNRNAQDCGRSTDGVEVRADTRETELSGFASPDGWSGRNLSGQPDGCLPFHPDLPFATIIAFHSRKYYEKFAYSEGLC